MTARRGTVLHFIDTTEVGGAEMVFVQVAAGLRVRGWAPRTVVVGPGWVLDTVRRLELPVDVVDTTGRLDIGLVRRLRRAVKRHGADLIHAHLFSPAAYASVVSAWTGTPLVATFHGASDVVEGGWLRALKYRLLARQARVACVSGSLRDALVEMPSMTGADIRVVHNGVDVDAFEGADGRAVRREHGIPEDAVLVGALGNMRPPKDYPTLLRAAARLAPDRRLVFAVVGMESDPMHRELLRLRDRLGLADRLSFWGFRSDIPEVMAAFDILAISSSSEGFSLAAVQAMAAGTPVVATRSGGPEEILTDEEDGLLVPTRDPEALAAAIGRVASDPALSDRLSSAARRTAAERFSLTTMLDRYDALYGELC